MRHSTKRLNALRGVRNILGCALPVLFLASVCAASPIYYLGTDQTGAQTQIDLAHTSAWLFTPNTDFTFGGGVLNMKDGSSSSADVIFNLYQGTDATGVFLGSVTVDNSTFCGQVNDCGQFGFHQFFLAAPVSVITGTSYFATLSSNAADAQDEGYFIKSTSYFVSDQNGTPVVPSLIGFTTATATPEPSSAGLIAFGLAGCLVSLVLKKYRTRSTAA